MRRGFFAPSSHGVSLEEAVRRYVVYLRNEFGATDRTVEDYIGVLRRFTRCFPDHLLVAFEPPHGTEVLREFIDALWGKSSSGTRGKVTSVYKSFFKFAFDNDMLVGDPAAKLKRPKRRGKQRRAHEPRDIQAIVRAQPLLRDRIGITLMARLGLRKNELRTLRFEDLDSVNKTIRIRGKGGKVAQLPIVCQEILDDLERLVLQEQPEPTDYVVHPKRGENQGKTPYEPSSMHRWFADCLKRAGVPHFPMHELRHTAATVFLRATGDLEQTRMFLRHESVATTQIYAHLLQDDLIVRTGTLKDSFDALTMGPQEFSYGTEVEYAHFHQDGGSVAGRPPQRKVIDIRVEDRRKLEQEVVRYVNSAAAKTFGAI